MDEHHDGADGAARLEEQDPRAVEEEEHGEAELHAVPEGADVVDPVVQRLPQPVLHRIFISSFSSIYGSTTFLGDHHSIGIVHNFLNNIIVSSVADP